MKKRMKKAMRFLCCVLALLTPAAVVRAAGERADGPAALYTWAIPCEYDQIELVTDKYFTVARGKDENGGARYDLYDWAGNRRIADMLEYTFYENWIIARGGAGYALYTYEDAACRVPQERSYEALWLKDENTAVGMQGTEFHRPGYWIGSAELIDTATGKVLGPCEETTEESTALPQRFITSEELFRRTGADGLKFVTDSDAPDDPMSVHDIQVYNADGQLLFDTGADAGKVWSHVETCCGGSLLRFYGDDGGPAARNWVYTGRGRLLLKRDAVGLLGGQYLAVMEEPCAILTRDGETVLDGLQSISCSYAVKGSDGSGYGGVIAESDDLVIVQRDGRWGVIRLQEHMPSPSPWAADEAGLADGAGLVPEDVKLWWRDSCTRLEFCRMLARTLEAATGRTIQELAAGADPAGFSDCGDPDVIAAASLGIIRGVGKGKFAPGCFLTREQAAALIARAARQLGIRPDADSKTFRDTEPCAAWAKDGIAAASSIVSGDGKALMRGTGNGNFSPKGAYTVEQSAITLYRLLRAAQTGGAGDSAGTGEYGELPK